MNGGVFLEQMVVKTAEIPRDCNWGYLRCVFGSVLFVPFLLLSFFLLLANRFDTI